MTLTLGVDIGAELVMAALATSDDLGSTRVLELGDGRAGIAAAVGAAADGSVLVGDAAKSAEGTVITDPLQRARLGRRGALRELLAYVIGRAAAPGDGPGAEPQRLGVIVPDDFDASARSQVVAAANSAGMTVVSTVPRSAALTRGSALAVADELARPACGAAAIAAVDAERILTREDVGGPVRTPDAAVPQQPRAGSPPVPERAAHAQAAHAGRREHSQRTPHAASSSGVSVFVHEDAAEPKAAGSRRPTDATVVAERVAAPPRPVPADSPPAPSGSAPGPQLGLPVMMALAVVIVIGILGATAVVLVDNGNDGSRAEVGAADLSVGVVEQAAPDEGLSEPLGGTSGAADASADSSSAGSSPAGSSPATSLAAGSSPGSTSSTSTTSTVPEPPSAAGSVMLHDSGLQLSSGGLAAFGTAWWVLLEQLTAVLGEPDYDSGLIVVSDCAGTRSRFVRYGSLELVFTETVEAPGTASFSQWHLSSADERFAAPERLGPGATVGTVQATFGEDLEIVAAFEGEPLGVFSVVNPASGTAVYGLTDDTVPEGVVTSVWAGDSCTRVFT